jgi:tetratricopeptide (TPR) repeat protein
MKVRVLAVLGAVLFLVASTAGAANKSAMTLARSKTAKGEALLKRSEYALAEQQFRVAISIEPTLPTCHLGLGASLVAQGRFDEALDALEEAGRKYVSWEQVIELADLQKRQLAERQLQTVRDLKAAQASRISNPDATLFDESSIFGGLSESQIETEQFIFRERWMLEEFDAIPPQVFYLEGIAYLRTNRREQGIEALRICLVIDPRHELAHYNLAVALFTLGDLVAAREHLDEAVERGVEPAKKFVEDLERATEKVRLAEREDLAETTAQR